MKKYMLATFLLLLAFSLLGSCFLLFTQAGLQFGVQIAEHLIPGQFRAEAESGRLADRFVLKDIRYSDNGVAVSLDTLSFTWEPAALFNRVLLVRALSVGGMDIEMTGSQSVDKTGGEKSPPSLVLPLDVKIDTLVLEDVNIALPGKQEPYRFDRIILKKSSAISDRIRFDRLQVKGPVLAVTLAGEVLTGRSMSASLDIEYEFTPDEYGVFAGRGHLTGSPAQIDVTADILQPFPATLQGTVLDPADELSWQAAVQSDSAYLPDINHDWPPFSLAAFSAAGSGTLATYSLQVEAESEFNDSGKMNIQTSIEGDADSLRFTALSLTRGEGQLSGTGELNWENAFTWQADLKGRRIMLSEIYPGMPKVSLTDIGLRGQGKEAGYNLQVDAGAQYGHVSGPVQLATGITGDADGLQLTEPVLTLGEGRMTGDARLAWRDGFRWNAEFVGDNLNPGVIDPQWPGSIDLRLNTEGRSAEVGVQGHFTLVSLTGQLRGYPVAAGGKAVIDGTDFSLDSFSLKTTGTEISAAGRIGETIALDLQADSSDLAVVWPELSGALAIDGRVEGKRRQPEIMMQVSGTKLAAFGNSIDTLSGEIETDFSPDGRIDAALNATQLVVAGNRVESVNIDLQGLATDHTLQVDAAGDDRIFFLEARGGYADEKWRGEIRQTEIHAGSYGNWNLQHAASVEAGEEMLVLNDICLAEGEEALICINGRQERSAGWQFNTQFKSLPLSLLQNTPVITADQNLTGTVSGDLSLAGEDRRIQNGTLVMATENISLFVNLTGDERHEISWRENTVRAGLAENRLTVAMKSVLQDGSAAEVSFTLDEFSPLAPQMENMKLLGTASVNILDLSPLTALTFPLVEPGGSLTGNFSLDGTAAHPLIEGQAQLANGKMTIPKLGITIEDLKVLVKGDEKLVDFRVSGSSGGGSIRADGDLTLESGAADSLRLTVTGEKFEAVQLPELVLFVNPRLEAKLSRQKGEIQGSVSIPQGTISPTTLAGTVEPSRDVVFVHADEGIRNEEWPLSAVITVAFGDQVEVDAFGLKGRIEGEIELTDLPGKIATGIGSLDVVDGTFAIYGRELKIEQGELLFGGGPVDNPGVSVRAENTTQNVTTGIAVSGFLREPEITFYSDPPMEENEIISRLLMNTTLVGSSEKESGAIYTMAAKTPLDPLVSTISGVKNALRVEDVRVETGKTSEDLSLVIGTWLTPRLYISYGKNLLKESGSFNTKYTLGHGFSVETETGATESGADLKYEIER